MDRNSPFPPPFVSQPASPSPRPPIRRMSRSCASTPRSSSSSRIRTRRHRPRLAGPRHDLHRHRPGRRRLRLDQPGSHRARESSRKRNAPDLAKHIHVFGGEERLWFGPEGGPFALFFPPKVEQTFANWKTPAAIDTEPFEVFRTHLLRQRHISQSHPAPEPRGHRFTMAVPDRLPRPPERTLETLRRPAAGRRAAPWPTPPRTR